MDVELLHTRVRSVKKFAEKYPYALATPTFREQFLFVVVHCLERYFLGTRVSSHRSKFFDILESLDNSILINCMVIIIG